ncbi:MAG TPA: family 20 glycosylhydrolase [Thermoanaerobaculales bacterium]|nr:family 20 glycosylhydrolase [Thermoanaerobaculales bacterium]
MIATLITLAATAAAGAAVAASSPATLDLMPMPRLVELGSGDLTITAGFTVSIDGGGATPRLAGGVQRMLRRLSDRSGLFFPPSTFLELTGRPAAALTISAGRAGALVLGEDESYTLRVAGDGMLLTAATDIGALRGLETVLQLVTLDERGVTVPMVRIEDAPRFPWRGLMIDASRHFMPVEVVKRNLDAMAAVKLNVLHWHLVDDQGFRVECLAFPRLHEAASDGSYYTRAQIREVQIFAAARGIRVVPEFDLPGHATAWATAYPELASLPGPYRIERSWGIFDPTLNPIQEETYRFLDAFFGEMAALFDDEFMHIGGDENNGIQWAANPEIAAHMAREGYADTLAMQRYFNERMLEIFTRHGKRMIGWDEIFQEGLPKDIVIHSWRGREALAEAASRGYAGILSNGYYIDLMQPTDFHYLNDPLPADSPLPEEARRLVLGGEATMWAEFVTPETVDSRIWPRTAAIAERLWSPGSVTDVADMYRRLDRISRLLEEHGLLHLKNRPMMLRRLCQCRDLAGLETLLGVVEPVKVYRRNALRKDSPHPYTQLSPLTRLVDIAGADAADARAFRWTVERMAADGFATPADIDAARQLLLRWRGNHATVVETLRASPGLAEMEPLSATLAETAAIGLEALELASSRLAAPAGWLEPRLARLEAARAPVGEAELMVVDPLVLLACLAAGPEGAAADGCRLRAGTGAAGDH